MRQGADITGPSSLPKNPNKRKQSYIITSDDRIGVLKATPNANNTNCFRYLRNEKIKLLANIHSNYKEISALLKNADEHGHMNYQHSFLALCSEK